MAVRPQKLSRADVVAAGWNDDEETARLGLASAEPPVRASSIGALDRMNRLSIEDVLTGLADSSPAVQRRSLLTLPERWDTTTMGIEPLATAFRAALTNSDPMVVETACFIAGECEPPAEGVLELLITTAIDHAEALCRESAVAALGSLGDERGRQAVLDACKDKATIRRRAVLALVAFDGPEVANQLAAMASDIDWQVRQAAEELLAIDAEDPED